MCMATDTRLNNRYRESQAKVAQTDEEVEHLNQVLCVHFCPSLTEAVS